jgi:hypothetical protein
VETIFDTLNAKAALFAIDDLFAGHKGYRRCPVMISGPCRMAPPGHPPPRTTRTLLSRARRTASVGWGASTRTTCVCVCVCASVCAVC